MNSVVEQILEASQGLEREIEQQTYWQTLTALDTPQSTILAIMRELMLEIWSKQMELNESVFTAGGKIGDVGRRTGTRPLDVVRRECKSADTCVVGQLRWLSWPSG